MGGHMRAAQTASGCLWEAACTAAHSAQRPGCELHARQLVPLTAGGAREAAAAQAAAAKAPGAAKAAGAAEAACGQCWGWQVAGLAGLLRAC